MLLIKMVTSAQIVGGALDGAKMTVTRYALHDGPMMAEPPSKVKEWMFRSAQMMADVSGQKIKPSEMRCYVQTESTDWQRRHFIPDDAADGMGDAYIRLLSPITDKWERLAIVPARQC